MNHGTLIVVCGYAGDRQQIDDLLPVYEHHQRPLLILSPEDSRIENVGPHMCKWAGKRAYIGQDSLDRQHLHMKLMLEQPFDWYLINDSDSFCLSPEIPVHYFKTPRTVYSNEVSDFRIPGQVWEPTGNKWPEDYHKGFPLIAMQPPYFMSRWALEQLVRFGAGLQADPITPFIDWYMVQCVVAAKVDHKPFQDPWGKYEGASCETNTEMGIRVMEDCIKNRSARFIHAIKTKEVKDRMLALYNQVNGIE